MWSKALAFIMAIFVSATALAVPQGTSIRVESDSWGAICEASIPLQADVDFSNEQEPVEPLESESEESVRLFEEEVSHHHSAGWRFPSPDLTSSISFQDPFHAQIYVEQIFRPDKQA